MSQNAFPGRLTPEDPDLSDRHRVVFAALVALHGLAARPVSSERIAQAERVGLSGASVRTALAELEEMGLLERAYASSARIPTSRGYEIYVRTLVEPAVLPGAILDAIDEQLAASAHDVERLLHDASRLLASITHQLGLALAASLDEETLTSLDIDPLSERRALIVLGLGGRSARTLVLELDTPLDRGALEQVASLLRERLLGHSLGEVRVRLERDPGLADDSAVRIVVRAMSSSWNRPVETPLLSSGAMNMAGQPEFANARYLGPVLQAVETGEPLNRLMVGGIQGQVGVRVGLDEARALAGCSLVSFPLPGVVRGAVGVLGPLRMDYAFTLAVVDRVGTRIADLLSA